MRLYRIFTAFCSLGITLTTLIATAQCEEGVKAGNYNVSDELGEDKCSNLTFFTSGMMIAADQIALGGINCTGAYIVFRDEQNESTSLVASKLLSGNPNGSIGCGNKTWVESDTIAVFNLKLPLPSSIVESVSDQVGIDLRDVQLETDVEYVGDKSCLWSYASKLNGANNTDDDEDDGDSIFSCFPPSAVVQLDNGRHISMQHLRIGDRVQTGPGRFSKVFAWTHRSPRQEATFVRIHTKLPNPLILTGTHFLYLEDGRLVPAKSVKVGDRLIADDRSRLIVHAVDRVKMKGLYNPQTMDGDIVVDGALVSTYTQAVEPIAAHALLAPIRAIVRTAVTLTSLAVL